MRGEGGAAGRLAAGGGSTEAGRCDTSGGAKLCVVPLPLYHAQTSRRRENNHLTSG